MDIENELLFHQVSTVTVEDKTYVDLANAKILLEQYNELAVDKARVDVRAERILEAMQIQSHLLGKFAKFSNKIEKLHGEDPKTSNLLNKIYQDIQEMSDRVDLLKQSPPIA